jgi:hypothetical protein
MGREWILGERGGGWKGCGRGDGNSHHKKFPNNLVYYIPYSDV